MEWIDFYIKQMKPKFYLLEQNETVQFPWFSAYFQANFELYI